jgi:hypothetical protein
MSGTAVPEPQPTRDLDDQLAVAARGLHRARWASAGAIAAVIAAGVAILGLVVISQQSQLRSSRAVVSRQQSELLASCAFWRALTAVPVQQARPGKPPSQLAVSIVSGARVAYLGQGCGKLPAPSSSFTHWALYYHLPSS